MECKDAGMIDRNGSVSLQGIDLRDAQLNRCLLSGFPSENGIDFRNANLMGGNLRYSTLDYSILNDANFQISQLQDSSIRNGQIINTDMSHASLERADLSNSNLEQAIFIFSNLEDASLKNTNLLQTDLSMAKLSRTDLSGAEPWNAKLYPDHISPLLGDDDYKQKRTSISSISQLIDVCNSLQSAYSYTTIYFRGESSNQWKLTPSVMRSDFNDEKFPYRANESEMLTELMTRRPNDFQHARSALDELVIAQHHGLPTRLLDITRNPLVALFWACNDDNPAISGQLHVFTVPSQLIKPYNSDTISMIANFTKLPSAYQHTLLGKKREDIRDIGPYPYGPINYNQILTRLCQLIQKEKSSFENRIDPRNFFQVFVVEPQNSFERIRAQSGAFLISAFHERFEKCQVLKWNSGIPIYNHYMWEILKEDKIKIRQELALLNITRETLLPGLDESARSIVAQYSLDRNDTVI